MLRIFTAATSAIGVERLRRSALENVPSGVVFNWLMDGAKPHHTLPPAFWKSLPLTLRSVVINELLFMACEGETMTLPNGLSGQESAAELRVDQCRIPWTGIRYVRVARDPPPMRLYANEVGGDPAEADDLPLEGFYIRRTNMKLFSLHLDEGIEIVAFSELPASGTQLSNNDDNHFYLPLSWAEGERTTLREVALRDIRMNEHLMDAASRVNTKRSVDGLLNHVIRALLFAM